MSPWFCTCCGAPSPEGSSFCPQCGRSIEANRSGSIVIGGSGSRRAIVDDIQRLGHTISPPGDVDRLLLDLRKTREASIAAKRSETDRAVQLKGQEISIIKSETRLIRRVLNRFRVRTLQSQVAELHAADARYTQILDARILRLESLHNSAELAGANAELTVIEELRSLPEAHVVVNDVQLYATRHIWFNGAVLRSAQIDHLVLGPTGVFVIDVDVRCFGDENATGPAGTGKEAFRR